MGECSNEQWYNKEEEKYLSKYGKIPPPPRWLNAMATYIWDEYKDQEIPEEELEKPDYFKRLKQIVLQG